MVRKFVYDPQTERVRLVAWTTASYRALSHRRRLRWAAVALAIAASVLAIDAVSSRTESAPAPAPAR